MQNIFNSIISFFYYEKCLVCGKKNFQICPDCFSRIPKTKSFENNVFSVYSYKNKLVDKMIWLLKYHHNHDFAKYFGAEQALFLYEKLLSEHKLETLKTKKIFLIPIPLNKNDKRLFNHAELLAKSIKDNLPLESTLLSDLLLKHNFKKQAHTKSREERFKNIEEAFSVNKKYLNNNFTNDQIFIFVDDVTTTGATLKFARETFAKNFNLNSDNFFTIVVAH